MLFLLAQVLEAAPVAPPDWGALLLTAANLLTPVATVALVWALKLAWARIPANLIMPATWLIGPLVNYALNWVNGSVESFNPTVGVIFGWLAIALREWLTTLPKGFGSVSITRNGL